MYSTFIQSSGNHDSDEEHSSANVSTIGTKSRQLHSLLNEVALHAKRLVEPGRKLRFLAGSLGVDEEVSLQVGF